MVFSWLCFFYEGRFSLFLSPLYSSFTFDILYVVCVCVYIYVGVVSDFTDCYFFSLYAKSVLRFFSVCVYINVSMYVCFNLCMCTQFLPDSGRVDTAVWMHYLDAN